MSVDIIINGISSERAREVHNAIRADGDGEIARPLYRSVIDWQSGYETEANVNGDKTIQGDEPSTYGGRSNGLSPQDLLLTAVGNCLAATYIGGLSARQIKVRTLRIHVSGRVNFKAAFAIEPGPPGFESIDIRVEIDADAPAAEVDALLQRLFPTAPIPDTILRPVPINLAVSHL